MSTEMAERSALFWALSPFSICFRLAPFPACLWCRRGSTARPRGKLSTRHCSGRKKKEKKETICSPVLLSSWGLRLITLGSVISVGA
jgi:hypothetical protein